LGNPVYNTQSSYPKFSFMKNNNALDNQTSATYVDLLGSTVTIPLVRAANLTIRAHFQGRWVGTPSISSFANIMVDGVQLSEMRVDVGVSGAVWSLNVIGRIKKAAGSVVIKNQVKCSTGTLSTIGSIMSVDTSPV
jgi:hypothetical protein